MSSAPTIAAGWTSNVLIKLADYHNGAAFSERDWAKDGLPIVRIEQINNPSSESDKFNGVAPASIRINNGDLIFSWSATLKVVTWQGGPAVLNQHLYKVVPKPEIDAQLLLHILDFNMNRLAGQSQGSTMKHVTRKELSRFIVCYPICRAVQKKIAHILQTIGQAIEKTEVLIEKYQQIKAGLMHDLFTRGIGADGQLRPPREQAPELYQETPIGWIPKEWQVRQLSSLTSKIVDGVHHTPKYVDHGVPFVTVKNLTCSKSIDFSSINYIDEKTHVECFARADPRPGDVLVTKDGTLGVCRIVEEGMPEFSIFVSVALLRVTNEIASEWLHLFFDSGNYLKQLGYLSSGTGLKHIHLEHFRKFQVALPCRLEQERMCQKVQIVEQRLLSERKHLSKLVRQKSGLMHDLLTGRVQVSVNSEAPEAANA